MLKKVYLLLITLFNGIAVVLITLPYFLKVGSDEEIDLIMKRSTNLLHFIKMYLYSITHILVGKFCVSSKKGVCRIPQDTERHAAIKFTQNKKPFYFHS